MKTERGLKPFDGPNRDAFALAEIRVLRRFAQLYPGGVKEIDPEMTVASSQPQPYVVLPQQAGALTDQSGDAVSYAGRLLPSD